MSERNVVQIQGDIVWQIEETEGGRWVGTCDVLQLTVESDTEDELKEAIGDAIEIIMKGFVESGGFEELLADHGLVVHGQWNVDNVFRLPCTPSQPNAKGKRQLPGDNSPS